MRVAIVGDYCEGYATHRAMLPALAHAGAKGVWIPTTIAESAATADGIWLAPGSPYASFEQVLALIRFARERGVPFLGTCGGFQHVLIEVARHVLGIPHADSAEHTAATLPGSVVVPVACPICLDAQFPKLYGGEIVYYLPGSHLARIMDVASTTENYFCNFEENPAFRTQFEAAGLRITAVNAAGVARALEWEGHPFFLATQFQPQMNSRPGAPHPLIAAFVDLLMKSA